MYVLSVFRPRQMGRQWWSVKPSTPALTLIYKPPVANYKVEFGFHFDETYNTPR